MMRINHYFNICAIYFLLTHAVWANDNNSNDADSTLVDYIRLSSTTALNRLIYENNIGGEHMEAMLRSLRERKNGWCYYNLIEMYAAFRSDDSVWSYSNTLREAVKIETECPLDAPDGERHVLVKEEMLDMSEFISLNESLDQLIQSDSLLDRIRKELGHPITGEELYSLTTSITVTPDGFRSKHASYERRINIDWAKVDDGYEIQKIEGY